MKKQPILMLATLAIFAAQPILLAETETAPPPPPAAREGDGPRGEGRSKLTAEQREKVRAAMLKANADPRVQAARDDMKAAIDDLQTVTQKALLAQDPSLAPTVEKLETARKERREKMKAQIQGQGAAANAQGTPGQGAGPGKERGFKRDGRGPGGFEEGALKDLPEEERAKVRQAYGKVQESPEVKAARERVQKSRGINQEAMRAALIAADPSLTPIMEDVMKMMDRRMGKHGKFKKGGES